MHSASKRNVYQPSFTQFILEREGKTWTTLLYRPFSSIQDLYQVLSHRFQLNLVLSVLPRFTQFCYLKKELVFDQGKGRRYRSSSFTRKRNQHLVNFNLVRPLHLLVPSFLFTEFLFHQDDGLRTTPLNLLIGLQGVRTEPYPPASTSSSSSTAAAVSAASASSSSSAALQLRWADVKSVGHTKHHLVVALADPRAARKLKFCVGTTRYRVFFFKFTQFSYGAPILSFLSLVLTATVCQLGQWLFDTEPFVISCMSYLVLPSLVLLLAFIIVGFQKNLHFLFITQARVISYGAFRCQF